MLYFQGNISISPHVIVSKVSDLTSFISPRPSALYLPHGSRSPDPISVIAVNTRVSIPPLQLASRRSSSISASSSHCAFLPTSTISRPDPWTTKSQAPIYSFATRISNMQIFHLYFHLSIIDEVVIKLTGRYWLVLLITSMNKMTIIIKDLRTNWVNITNVCHYLHI